jgi:hypothetical protein
VRKTLEPTTKKVREDLRLLTDRFKSREVQNFIPSMLRTDADFQEKVEHYYGMPFEKWLETVRRK